MNSFSVTFLDFKLKRLPMNSPELYSQSSPSVRDKKLFLIYQFEADG